MKNVVKFCILPVLLLMVCGNLKAQWSINLIEYDVSGGKGSSAGNPILIESAGHLAYLANRVANVANYSQNMFFEQTQDINLNVNAWDVPIGISAARPFQGTFDGKGCKILNIGAIASGETYRGLFGRTSGAVINNVIMALRKRLKS